MARLSLSLLGPFRAALDGVPITQFPTDKIRALLAYLAIEADRPHRRDTLAALLWPDWSDEVARRNLRQSLHRLKQTLDRASPTLSDALLAITPQTVQLNRAALRLDVATFGETQAACAAHPHRHLHGCQPCLARLAEAADLYEGELLAGLSVADAVAFEEWLVVQREALHHQALTLLGTLAAAHERRGDWERAYRYATRQLALEPWHEEAHRQAMRALAGLGQRSEALDQYASCCRTLADELGVEPAAETTALYRQIQSGTFRADERAFALPALHHLPAQFTGFVGRERELAQIVEQLTSRECRLLTLVGPGGIGKTRLSIRAAEQLAASRGSFPDGIFFVPLAAVAGAELLASAIAASLGLSLQGPATPKAQLFDFLRAKELLLVLDNFEHLLAGAGLLAEILTVAPEVKLLATSREPLALRAEWRLPLDGLPFPDAASVAASQRPADPAWLSAYSAVTLFVQAGAQVQPGFSVLPDQQGAVARLCQLAQGVPLALELAATWVRMYDCETIAQEVARSLDFLETPLRDVPERHRSVRAVFDHSWQLLDGATQAALAQCSIFRGGFTLEAALAVTEARPAHLAALLDKSLLRRAAGGRFEIHDLVRQFAAEKLAEPTPLLKQHSAFYLKLVGEMGGQIWGAEPRGALATLRAELDNIRQAWNEAVTHGWWEGVAASVEGLSDFYYFAGLVPEGVARVRELAALLPARGAEAPTTGMAAIQSRMLVQWAELLAVQGEIDEALVAARAALEAATLSGDAMRQAQAHTVLGEVLRIEGNLAEALLCQQQALTLYEAAHEEVRCSLVLDRMGRNHWYQGANDRALECFNRALPLAQKHASRLAIANIMGNLGVVYKDGGQYEQALACYGQALQASEELGNQSGMARRLNDIAVVHRLRGEYDRALDCYRQALELDHAQGQGAGVATRLGNIGLLYAHQGEYAQALPYLQESLELCQRLGGKVLLANTLVNLGFVRCHLAEYDQALAHYEQAIPLAREGGAMRILTEAQIGQGEVLLQSQHLARAQSLADEAVRRIEALGQQGEVAFRGYLLLARLADARGDRAAALRQLQTLLAATTDEAQQATLHYELWKLGEDDHALRALTLLEQLCERRPTRQHRERLAELVAATRDEA